MRPIEFACPSIGQLRVIGERLHDGHDFAVRSNADNAAIDYLLFLDSRGISSEFEQSLADKLITRISQSGKTYLLVCRPLELTIWATLIGFLGLNKLNPAKIITNMGFVDFTPKKQSILQDAVQQVESVVGRGTANFYYVENYALAGGRESIPLYAMHYGETYRHAIETIAKQHDMVILNSPLIAPGIAIERKRPLSFFSAQAESNAFNRSIRGAQVVDLPDFDETLTYDAVHFTHRGNELVFDRLKDYL